MKNLRIIMALVLLVTNILPVFADEVDLPSQAEETVVTEILESNTISDEEIIAEGDDEIVDPSETVEDVTDNENDTASDEEAAPSTESEESKLCQTAVDNMGKGTKFSIQFFSRTFRYSNALSKYEFEDDLTDEQKKDMLIFLQGLSALCASGESIGKDHWIRTPDNKYDYYMQISIEYPQKIQELNTESIGYGMRNNLTFSFDTGVHNIKDPQAVADYVCNAFKDELSFIDSYQSTPRLDWRGILDYKNQTYQGYSVRFSKWYEPEPMTYIEKLSFDVKLDDTYYDTEFGEIADSGEVVHCTIEQYYVGYMIFVLTMEGSRGTKQFFNLDYSWGFSSSTSGNKMSFYTDHIVEDGVCSAYSFTNTHTISFVGSTTGDSISAITMSYVVGNYGSSYNSFLNQPLDLEAYNIEYEYYHTPSYFKSNRNLVVRFGLPITRPDNYGKTETEPDDHKQETDKTDEEKTESTDADDVDDSTHYADTLNELGLFKGTESGYELDKPLTREESATMIVRLRGKESEALAGDYNEVFTDSPKDKWSFPYVMYCYENEITKGTGSDTFTPESNISAEEFITFVLRLLGYTDAAPENAYDMALEVELLDTELVKKLQSSDAFLREDMVYIAYSSLKTKSTSGELLANTLLDDGVISQDQADEFDVIKSSESMSGLLDT